MRKKLILGILGLLGVVGVGVLVMLLLYILEPAAPLKNLTISNISDSKVTLSWTTEKPTRGQVLISETGQFPKLPVFRIGLKNDEKGIGFYTTHYLTLDNLKENSVYQFRIYQGLKVALQSSFSTGKILTQVPPPNLLEGRVISVDKKSFARGAIVYLRVIKDSSQSSQPKAGRPLDEANSLQQSNIMSTLTDQEGKWRLDLGDLKDKDLKKGFFLEKGMVEEVRVEFGEKGTALGQIKVGQGNVFPDLILTKP